MGAIYEFYASPISTKDINRLQAGRVIAHDISGYISRATDKFRTGQPVPYSDLMGNFKFFKGLSHKGGATYILKLIERNLAKMAQSLFSNIDWQITDGQLLNVPNQNINWVQSGISRSNTISIVVPIDRYSELDNTLTYRVSDIPTLHHLLGAIYEFYASPISVKDINRLQASRVIAHDTPGYISRATDKFRTGQPGPYSDLMGDLTIFEGLNPKGDGIYDLNLGS